HIRPARSRSAAGAGSDFFLRSLSLRQQPIYFFSSFPAFLLRHCRHSRVGSSSGSGVSCSGRSASGTWRRLTRIRVQVEDLPRIESIKTSSVARRLAIWGCLLFHLSRPACAAVLSG